MCVGIANYALTVMHGVKAFARMLREPQHDTPYNICGKQFIFRTPIVTTPARAENALALDSCLLVLPLNNIQHFLCSLNCAYSLIRI